MFAYKASYSEDASACSSSERFALRICTGREEVTEGHLKADLRVRRGHIRDVKVSLYAIVRDEIFFVPAFFDHYRRLGVQQFIILDDGSTDGTLEYLEKQKDCVVLASRFRYGQLINFRGADGRRKLTRAGPLLKSAIPKKFLSNRYALYADADEFLILPKGVESVASVFDYLARRKVPCVAASLIDFFPRSVRDLKCEIAVSSFEDLIHAYPCFDAGPLIKLHPGRQPRHTRVSASTRLFSQCGIKDPPGYLNWLPAWVIDALPLPAPRTAWVKTPIVHWQDDLRLNGSHKANRPPPADLLLAIAHFKFTGDFSRRVAAAMREKCHARGSQKYFNYHRLLQRLEVGSNSLMGPATRIFQGAESLEGTGLMKWPSIELGANAPTTSLEYSDLSFA
jgi:hypothetical protein